MIDALGIITPNTTVKNEPGSGGPSGGFPVRADHGRTDKQVD